MRSRRYQQQRIIAAAEAWLATHPQYGNDELRFDAMLIAPGHLPRHLDGGVRRDAIVMPRACPAPQMRLERFAPDRPDCRPAVSSPQSLEIR